MELSAYLHFNGQCAAAFKFYETCLGGKIVMTQTRIFVWLVAAES